MARVPIEVTGDAAKVLREQQKVIDQQRRLIQEFNKGSAETAQSSQRAARALREAGQGREAAFGSTLELERELLLSHPGIARAPSLRTCVGQAHAALGHTSQALDLYRGVADALGAETPPQLYVMIAQNHLRLGEADEARTWLRRARAAAGGDPSLQSQIRRLADRIRQVSPDPRVEPERGSGP